MPDSGYDALDDDPKLAADLAYLREALGVPPRQPSLPSQNQLKELFRRALATTDAAIARERRIKRRKFVGAIGGAVAAAATGFLAVELPRPRPAEAATPSALAITRPGAGAQRATLLGLADNAQHCPDATTGVDHLITDKWDLNGAIDGKTITSAVITSRRELWRTAENQARTIDTYLPPQFPTNADRASWQAAGSPTGAPRLNNYPPGKFFGMFLGRPPRDPGQLAGWLSHTIWLSQWIASQDSTILRGVGLLLRERALVAPERAALLRALATRTTLHYAGTAVDRAGRSGAAFTTTTNDGGQVTHLLVIDEITGRILATEQTLTAGDPQLRLHLPAVIGYSTYLRAEQVPSIP